jgi:hypothetical protein
LVALIFVRQTSDPLTGLVKKIDKQLDAAGMSERAPGAYIIFVNNADGLDKQLQGIAEKEALKRVHLCIGAPPDDYDVAKDADVTVVIYTFGRRGDQKVTANFALRKGELDEAKTDAIIKALSEVLPK